MGKWWKPKKKVPDNQEFVDGIREDVQAIVEAMATGLPGNIEEYGVVEVKDPELLKKLNKAVEDEKEN